MSPTRVARHVLVPSEPGEARVARLRAELKAAAAEGRPVAVGVARHSMGGQSLVPEGVALTLEGGGVEIDTAARRYRAAAGTRWRQVIPALDAAGLSPAVMQSNNDFGIGSTFCVNAHGWAVPCGPFGTTVRHLRLLLADGTLVACSPTEEPELFAHAMGGYGLFGLVVDLELDAVPNRALAPDLARLPADGFADAFLRTVRTPEVAMAYGRLSVSRSRFLEEAVLVAFRARTGPVPPPEAASLPWLQRLIYRGQTGSEAGKRLRWLAETQVAPHLAPGRVARNALLNVSAAVLANRDPARVDILHEYFLPPEGLAAFLAACRTILPAAGGELLNVTLRHVEADPIACLAYAPQARIAAVMSFSHDRTPEADAAMGAMTRRLIEAAIGLGGSFYLPYRTQAHPDQVRRAYPRADAFAALKRRYDPDLRFRNGLWDAYFAQA
ncbi:FAD-binding oxidoreductase [Methylobacterium sp. Leaf118]|uniref:FAD-binding oxidoreductase n=1 Tax=Methylobacterium sp. Leaf118 TaxID=2876562 RepID=UPI001E32D8C1|nr:FAD-binding oxidoreductase [Methylobacterium sp. Leaf118]